MAKVYETEKDFKRDQVKEELKSNNSAMNTLFIAILATASNGILFIPKKDALGLNNNKYERDFGWLSMGVAAIGAVTSLYLHFFVNSKLKNELKALGPEEIRILENEPKHHHTDSSGVNYHENHAKQVVEKREASTEHHSHTV